METDSLLPPHSGDPIAAAWAQRITALVKRQIKGPGVIISDDGIWIPGGGPSQESGIGLAVMRGLTLTGTKSCQMQEVDYSGDDKLEGEDDFHKHVVAIGSPFEVYPPPTGTWEQFDVEGALRLVEEAEDPENLSSAPLWWFTRDKYWAWLWLKAKEHILAVAVAES
jgi:hypothetical protein